MRVEEGLRRYQPIATTSEYICTVTSRERRRERRLEFGQQHLVASLEDPVEQDAFVLEHRVIGVLELDEPVVARPHVVHAQVAAHGEIHHGCRHVARIGASRPTASLPGRGCTPFGGSKRTATGGALRIARVPRAVDRSWREARREANVVLVARGLGERSPQQQRRQQAGSPGRESPIAQSSRNARAVSFAISS